MREGAVFLARQHPAKQTPLPDAELERLARRTGDGVFGDGYEVLGEVSDDVAQAASEVSVRDWRQPARWPAFCCILSRYLSMRLWLSTIAMPNLARSAGVSPR